VELIEIFLEMLDKPNIERPYKTLQQYYENVNNPHLSEAFKELIKAKFNDHDKSTNV